MPLSGATLSLGCEDGTCYLNREILATGRRAKFPPGLEKRLTLPCLPTLPFVALQRCHIAQSFWAAPPPPTLDCALRNSHQAWKNVKVHCLTAMSYRSILLSRRRRRPPPSWIVPYGNLLTANLVTLTLSGAHAWQNIDMVPQGIGGKQDFAL